MMSSLNEIAECQNPWKIHLLEMQGQLRNEEMTLDNGAGKIPILKKTCVNAPSFLEGLKAVREDNQHSRGGTVIHLALFHKGEGSMPSLAAYEHDFSWALNPLSLSIHNVKHPVQRFIGGSLRKTFSSFQVSAIADVRKMFP